LGAKKIKGVNRFIEKPEDDLPFYERFRFWVDENTNRILAAVGAFLALLLIFWGFNAYRDSQQKRAAAEYAQLVAKWPGAETTDAATWETLVSELEKFIANRGGTKAALNAELDLALAFFRMGKFDEAAKWSGKVVADAPAGHDLKPFAVYQLALTYEALGKGSEAFAQWNILKGYGAAALNREAEWHLARFCVAKKDYAAAVVSYEQAIKEAGFYPATALLEEEMAFAKSQARLGAGKDKEGSPKEEPKG
jgi:predicted negative regulator of RcsB-dependent stress response